MTTSDVDAVRLPRPGTYRLDPARSKVSYSGRHMFGLGTVRATFGVTSGEITVADPPTTTSTTVVVDAASFASGNARRDRDVVGSGLLDVATYPEIVFTSERIREDGDHWVVEGAVTAHGATAPVEVVLDRLTSDDLGLSVHGHAEHVDRTALGVTGSRGMVGRYLDLQLDAFAERVG